MNRKQTWGRRLKSFLIVVQTVFTVGGAVFSPPEVNTTASWKSFF
jgi:hypothetical protein